MGTTLRLSGGSIYHMGIYMDRYEGSKKVGFNATVVVVLCYHLQLRYFRPRMAYGLRFEAFWLRYQLQQQQTPYPGVGGSGQWWHGSKKLHYRGLGGP